MIDIFSISLSVVALLLSGFTFWFSFLRRSKLRMTKPSIVFFGFDFSPKTTPKVFLRTLLYSGSPRGNVVESMYAAITHDNHTETFSFWGYGETNKLTPGSGLFVPREGVAFNHHFVLSVHKEKYAFTEGKYLVQVFAKLVTDHTAHKLYELTLELSTELATALNQHEGVLFELEPDTDNYVGHRNQQSGR